MLRLLGVACGAVALLVVVAGCSSSSKPRATATPSSMPATVLLNGTVVVGGTPVSGQAAATIIAAATSGVPLTGNANPNAVRPGTPGAAAGSPVPVSTPLPGATSAASASAGSVTPGSTAVGGAQTPVNIPPGAGFTLTVPQSPSGSFDVTANVTAPPPYAAFQVDLSFDPSFLKVTGIDYGGAMGPLSQVFCAPNEISSGRAKVGCVHYSKDVTSGGALAIFHFQVLGAGTTSLHFNPFVSPGSNGTFLAKSGVGETAAQSVITLPLHDATITVSP